MVPGFENLKNCKIRCDLALHELRVWLTMCRSPIAMVTKGVPVTNGYWQFTAYSDDVYYYFERRDGGGRFRVVWDGAEMYVDRLECPPCSRDAA